MAERIESIRDFLAQRRIAVAGVSRDPNGTANLIYRKLRDAGHEVFPVNPATAEAEGVRCHADLSTILPPPDGVVLVTPAGAALELVQQCHTLGIPRVWMHRMLFAPSSGTPEAARFGRDHGLTIIAGGCPMMFVEPVDGAHRFMRFLLGYRGR